MEVNVKAQDGIADFSIPGGCPVCEGALSMRIRQGTSWGYCAHCRWIGRKHVAMAENTLRVLHVPAGLA